MFEWLFVSVIGALIDCLLITIFLQIKKPVKHYKIMIFLFTTSCLVCSIVPIYLNVLEQYRQLLQLLLYLIIFYGFSEKQNNSIALKVHLFIENTAYLGAPYLFISLIDILVYNLMGLTVLSFLANSLVKLFLFMIAKEDQDFQLKYKILGISKKMLLIVFLFITMAVSYYVFLERW